MSLREKDNPYQSRQKNSRLSVKARRVLAFSIIAALIVAFIVSLIISNFSIKITKNELSSDKINSSVRLAIISDLHGRELGKNNKKLLSKIEDQNPDLILMVGDIISSSQSAKEQTDYLKHLISNLTEIAPVYFSLGNHDKYLPQIESIVNSAGAVFLDESHTEIQVNGNILRIGGISHYRTWDENACSFLEDFSKDSEDVFTLLLCHFPEFYLWGIKDYPIDLTISGHTHGGMVRLPLLGPLYAPEQGWFPDYAAGIYSMENGYLAITTGLASSPEYLPRVFNRPEIMIIDLE